MAACDKGHLDVARLLLDRGAKVDAADMPSQLVQQARQVLSSLRYLLQLSSGAIISSRASVSSTDHTILLSPWFNYYEKLMLWHIHKQAVQQLEPQMQEALQAAQQLLTQHDLEWLGTLVADFHARSDRKQQEEVRRRLNWHEWCSEHLWELHMRDAEVAGRFTSADDMLRHIRRARKWDMPHLAAWKKPDLAATLGSCMQDMMHCSKAGLEGQPNVTPAS
jgi:hypothetical protein